MIVKADLWVLDQIYQPISDWINDLTGENCFSQARMLWRSVLFISMLITVMAGFTMVTIVANAAIILPLTYLQLWIIYLDEKDHQRCPKFMNRRRNESFLRKNYG